MYRCIRQSLDQQLCLYPSMGPEVVWVSGEKKDEKKKEGRTERKKKDPRDAAVAGENKQPGRQLKKERADRPAGKD